MQISVDKTTNRAARLQGSEIGHAATSGATTEIQDANPELQSSSDADAVSKTQAEAETRDEAETQAEAGTQAAADLEPQIEAETQKEGGESSRSGANAPSDRKGKGREVESA